MKNQYFGDIGDYKKYSLLRTLSTQGQLKIIVCWMLTEDDERSDGKFVQYLSSPNLWRKYDEPVFDLLAQLVLSENSRRVHNLKQHNILPNTTFYSEILADDRQARERYFDQLNPLAKQTDVVFFDPDNGLEVKSVQYGRRNSSKYIYWQEIVSTYEAGCSVLFYQHFARQSRDVFVSNIANELLTRTSTPEVVSIRTPHSVYFFALQPQHRETVNACMETLTGRWGKHLQISKHT